MNSSITKYTLFEYLSGRGNFIEKQRVEDWLKKPENTETFHEWLLEWELRSPQFSPNTAAAFQKLSQKIDPSAEIEEEIEIFQENKPWRLYFFTPKFLAASVAFLILSVSAWFSKDAILYKTYQTDFAEMSSFLLEDGSHVSLNANSSLRVPRWGFDKKIREVKLAGEAEFSITHTSDNQRFVVKTSDNFQVEVLGTEFSVFARKRGTKVVLNKGKIRVDYTTGTKKDQLLMKPGDLLTLNQDGKINLQKTPDPQVHSAWKTRNFVFNDTSVKEILYLLNENFGVNVETPDAEISERTISGTFKAQNSDELLEVLSEVLNLEVTRSDKSISLTNK